MSALYASASPAPATTYAVPLLAAAIGGTIASLVGRPHTRVDNAIIGAAFTGFAAYRDPRAQTLMTLLVAVAEGAIWGVSDRLAPVVKDFILPGAHTKELPASPSAVSSW